MKSEFENENELNIKFLSEPVAYYTSTWRMKKKLPFRVRFNEIIRKASEFGLLKDFYFQPNVLRHNPSPPEKIKRKTILLILLYVSVIGYSLSIITFLLEILLAKFENRMYDFYTSGSFVNWVLVPDAKISLLMGKNTLN